MLPFHRKRVLKTFCGDRLCTRWLLPSHHDRPPDQKSFANRMKLWPYTSSHFLFLFSTPLPVYQDVILKGDGEPVLVQVLENVELVREAPSIIQYSPASDVKASVFL